jgi:hypothetical protein
MGSSRSRKNSYYALKNSSVQMMEEEDVEENGEFVLTCDLCYVRRLTQEGGGNKVIMVIHTLVRRRRRMSKAMVRNGTKF